MKNSVLALSIAFLAIFAISCDKEPEPTTTGQEKYIESTADSVWHYFSMATGEVVGKGIENDEENAQWFARTDWDFAVKKYQVRTNSGSSTTANGLGGVYTSSTENPDEVTTIPAAASFKIDELVTSEGMGGVTTTSLSDATVIVFKTNEDGSLVMPPVYEKAPVYIFRTADGASYYKVDFTQYLNEDNTSGHVKFNLAKM